MNVILVLPYYFKWHYGRAWKDLTDNCVAAISFVGSFFSFSALLRTLFSPWKRLGETYEKGLDAENILSTFIVNTITRALGFVIRSAVLIFGTIVLALTFLAVALVYAIWALFPFIVAFLFALGIFEIFS